MHTRLTAAFLLAVILSAFMLPGHAQPSLEPFQQPGQGTPPVLPKPEPQATAPRNEIPTAPAVPKVKVYYAMDAKSIGASRSISPSVTTRMVDSLVCGLTGRHTVAEAWRTLINPADVVGIKVAAQGRNASGTNPEVVNAIASGLREAGVPAKNIIVWDRNLDDLLAAGYDRKSSLYTLGWVDPATGYDPQAQVSAPILGKLIWGDRKFGDTSGMRFADLLSTGEQVSSSSYYAKVLSQVTKIINVPSLTDSFLTGINGAFVNVTLSNLDNWRRFAKSASEGDSYIAELYADPLIKDKIVLTIMDALVLQYAGGPFPNPNFSLDNYTIFASRDPVAIDSTAVRLIDEARKASKLPSVKTMTTYVEAGKLLGLGEDVEGRIDMIRVGVEGIR